MSQIVNQARLDANWSAVSAELDAPTASVAERCLGRLSLPSHITRLIVATPALRRAWYLAIGIAVLIGVGSAQPNDPASVFVLLAIAPALPVLGVAMAYGPSADPMYEAQLATPMRGLRLVAIRAATVLVVAIIAIGVPALLASTTRSMAFAWLLPALALTSASLALMTWLPPRRATAIVAVVWFVGVVIARGSAPTNSPHSALSARSARRRSRRSGSPSPWLDGPRSIAWNTRHERRPRRCLRAREAVRRPRCARWHQPARAGRPDHAARPERRRKVDAAALPCHRGRAR